MSQTQPTENKIEEPDYRYTNLDATKIDSCEPKKKSFGGGKIEYSDVPLQYNYGTVTQPLIGQFFVELPEVLCYGGIKSDTETKPPLKEGDPPYVKERHAMMFSFDLKSEENINCLNKLDEVWMGCSRALGKQKAKVGLFDYDPERPGSSFKNPVYYKRDQVSGERVKGIAPSLWVKLNAYRTNKTLFTDVEGEPIDWSLLADVEVKLVPLIMYSHIYVGTKITLQIKLISAIVTDIAEINTKTRQTRTLDRLKQNASLANNVASQLAQLRMNRQDSINSNNSNAAHRHTVATLPDDGTMHNIPDAGKENLDDFLNGRSQAPPQQQAYQAPQQQYQAPQQTGYQQQAYQPAPQQYQAPQQTPHQYQLPTAPLPQLSTEMSVPAKVQLNPRPQIQIQ